MICALPQEEVDLRVLLCQDEPSLTVTPFMETLKELFADNREWEEMLNIPDKAVSIPWRFLDSRLLPLYAVTFWAKKLQYVQSAQECQDSLLFLLLLSSSFEMLFRHEKQNVLVLPLYLPLGCLPFQQFLFLSQWNHVATSSAQSHALFPAKGGSF